MLGSVRGVVSNDHSYRDKANPRVPTLFRARKATRFGRTIARSERPGVVEEPGMCRSSLHGNREVPRLAGGGLRHRPASGIREFVRRDVATSFRQELQRLLQAFPTVHAPSDHTWVTTGALIQDRVPHLQPLNRQANRSWAI